MFGRRGFEGVGTCAAGKGAAAAAGRGVAMDGTGGAAGRFYLISLVPPRCVLLIDVVEMLRLRFPPSCIPADEPASPMDGCEEYKYSDDGNMVVEDEVSRVEDLLSKRGQSWVLTR